LECTVVAIAEPRKKTRENFAKQHEQTIEYDLIFDTWEAMIGASKAKGSKLCDAVVIAVQDQLHKAVVLAFAELHYDILCEKPMATAIQDCLEIHDAIVKANVIFGMGHGGFESEQHLLQLRRNCSLSATSNEILSIQ
jgi:predicted dehydrogenase